LLRNETGKTLPKLPIEWSAVTALRAGGRLFVSCFIFGTAGVLEIIALFEPESNDSRMLFGPAITSLCLAIMISIVARKIRSRSKNTTAVRTSLPTELDEKGLVIRYAWARAIILAICSIGAWLGSALFGAEWLFGFLSNFTNQPTQFWAVSFFLMGAGFTWLLIQTALRRNQRGAVILTPKGVLHRTGFADFYLPWENIAQISAARSDNQVIKIVAIPNTQPHITVHTWLANFKQPSTTQQFEIPGIRLTLNSALLLHVLFFYHAAPPSFRAELATEAAVNRIRGNNIPLTDRV